MRRCSMISYRMSATAITVSSRGPAVQEIEVIRRTRSFLQASGLAGHRVLDLYTDAHPTLTRDQSLQPFQRFTLTFDGFSAHPDLAGRLDDGETTFGVEAKGEDDLLRGIAQADLYRAGFHLALFASAGVPSTDLVTIARQRGVGVLAVTADEVTMIDLALARDHHREPGVPQLGAGHAR